MNRDMKGLNTAETTKGAAENKPSAGKTAKEKHEPQHQNE
jgi:hypothetical protein